MGQNTSERRYTWCSYGLFTSDCPAALHQSTSIFLPHLVGSSFDPISTSLHPFLLLSLYGCSVIISLSGFALRWLLRCQHFLTDLLIALGKQRQTWFSSLSPFFLCLSAENVPQWTGMLSEGDGVDCLRPSLCIHCRESLCSHAFYYLTTLSFLSLHLPVPPPLLPTAPDQTHSDWGWDPEAQKQGKGLKPLIRWFRTAGYCQDDGNRL